MVIVIKTASDRQAAAKAVMSITREPLMEVVIREHRDQRTIEQNKKMWAMLGDIAGQVPWSGKLRTAEDWKDLFTAAMRQLEAVPGLEGGVVLLGGHTSKMSIKEMSDLVEYMYSFGAEHGVVWSEQA